MHAYIIYHISLIFEGNLGRYTIHILKINQNKCPRLWITWATLKKKKKRTKGHYTTFPYGQRLPNEVTGYLFGYNISPIASRTDRHADKVKFKVDS